MDSSGSERISLVNTPRTVDTIILTYGHIIVYEIEDKQGARNADLAKLENSLWFIALCMCGSSVHRSYQNMQRSSTGHALKEISSATFLSLAI